MRDSATASGPSTAPRDEATTVRESEAIDAGALDVFLRTELPAEARASLPAGLPTIKQFRGGASNLTYLVTYGAGEGAPQWVVRRAPPAARSKAAHDVVREATLMAALRPFYPLVPKVLASCTDESVLGTQFYVMERVPGVILRRDLPPGLDVSPFLARTLCDRFVDAFARLHEVDASKPEIAALGRGQGYVRRQIEGWTERYGKARTDDVPDYAEVIRWLHDHMPQEQRLCVIHNDFRFDNLVLDPEQGLTPVGVLDWEMATVGDPLMDLGTSLAYWVEAGDDPQMIALRRQPTNLPGMMTRKEVVAAYAARAGIRVPDFAFYEVYGLFRLAGIAQQLYARFRRGLTQNPELAIFGLATIYLESRCTRIVRDAS